MEILYAICCGLDVHKDTVTACLRRQAIPGPVTKTLRTFGTTTPALLSLLDWLGAAGCTHVAMESTGQYWKPVFHILEGSFEGVLVVNARHVKALPGRKTDMLDAEWLAQLLQHGLLRGSFIPPAPIRELREATRYRKQLVRARADEANRIQKLLEGANLKLASVATDILGVSGRAMLAALVTGETDPTALASLAKGRLRKKRDQLVPALTGRIAPVQRTLLGQQLAHVAYLDQAIAELDTLIATLMVPYQAEAARLRTMPGIDTRLAEALVAELGVDMAVFPSEDHCASWAGLCPGNNESAGKRKSGKTRKGNQWLQSSLVEGAWAASHTRSYLGAQYHRLARRRGKKKAVVAVAHSMLVIAYHILKDGTTYRELGHDYFDRRDTARLQRRLITRLESLGLRVTVEPFPQAA
ncbi:MAG TPA: IS110 family transposase [Candidatus Methylomirabilis sp.]|nr:IS110 family transposase [Candidatus Methylomirabilis sp.]